MGGLLFDEHQLVTLALYRTVIWSHGGVFLVEVWAQVVWHTNIRGMVALWLCVVGYPACLLVGPLGYGVSLVWHYYGRGRQPSVGATCGAWVIAVMQACQLSSNLECHSHGPARAR